MTRDWSGTISEANTAPPVNHEFFCVARGGIEPPYTQGFHLPRRSTVELSSRCHVLHSAAQLVAFLLQLLPADLRFTASMLSANTFVTLCE